jgi:ABC-type multidrug transport system fused ATPase/permease subunit
MNNIFAMVGYLKGDHKRLMLVVMLNLLRSLFVVVIPIIFKNIIDQIGALVTHPVSNPYPAITRSLVFLALAFLIQAVLVFYAEKISEVVQMHTRTDLRDRVFPKILDLSVDYIEKHKPGTVMQQVNQGIGDFADWLWSFNSWLGQIIFGTIFIIVILLTKNLLIGSVFLVVCPLMLVLNIVKVRKAKEPNKRANSYYEKFAGQLSETISHLTTIKSLSAEAESEKIFRNYTSAVQTNRLKQFKIQRRYNAVRDIIGNVAVLVSVAIVTFLAIKGRYSAGDIFLVAFYTRDLTNSMQPIGHFIDDTANCNITSGRLVSLLNAKPTFEDVPDAKDLPELKSASFSNLSFTYPDAQKGAINNIGFELKPGKVIALVGPSGVGKSTITKLMMRFYLPTTGEFMVNNQNAEGFTQDSIRRHMAIVMQDVALFNTSLLENIKIAKPNATSAEVEHAAKLAHAHDFIKELPKGYNTLVGERGIKLSGGQKQRVAIARAILKNPELIILDEATSALDSQSEKLVQEGIQTLLEGRMAIVIAHRLSTVRHADEILVMEKGKVVERGNHTELIKQGGLYKRLFDLQSTTGKIEL